MFQERLFAAGASQAVRQEPRRSPRSAVLGFLVTVVALAGCGPGAFRLLQTLPADAPTDLSRNSSVQLVFSESVDASRLEVALTPRAPIHPPQVNGDRVIVRPVESWAADTAYTVTVRVQGLGDETPPSSITTRFTTGRTPLLDSERPPDVGFTPASGMSGVKTDAVLELTFSHPMDTRSVEQALHVEPAVGCPWEWDADGKRCTCAPQARLSLDTAYTLRLAASARRAQGGPALASDVVRTFRTLPAPALTRVTPGDDARGVLKGSFITLDFSRGMQCESVRKAFHLTGPGGTQVPGTLECEGPGRFKFIPGRGGTQYGETYRWGLDAGVLDTVGDPTAAAVSGRFTVARLGTRTLAAVLDGDGTVDAQGGLVTDSGVLRVGRDARVGVLRALLTFDVSALPEGTVHIEDATLRFTQRGVVGDPYSDHGALIAGQVFAGSIDATDFEASPYTYRSCDGLVSCTHKPRRYTLSTTGGRLTRSLSVVTAAQVALSERKSLQFLLFFAGLGDAPGDTSAELASASAEPGLAPTLTVRYQYP